MRHIYMMMRWNRERLVGTKVIAEIDGERIVGRTLSEAKIGDMGFAGVHVEGIIGLVPLTSIRQFPRGVECSESCVGCIKCPVPSYCRF